MSRQLNRTYWTRIVTSSTEKSITHALGAHVVVFTTSPNKKDDALRLGADEVVVSRDANEMQKHAGSIDFDPQSGSRRD